MLHVLSALAPEQQMNKLESPRNERYPLLINPLGKAALGRANHNWQARCLNLRRLMSLMFERTRKANPLFTVFISQQG